MASMAVQSRRRELTYGKKAPREHGFSTGFESLSLRTPQKSPSRLPRLHSATTSRSRASSSTRQAEEIFDVPSSDGEGPPPPSPTPKRTSKALPAFSSKKLVSTKTVDSDVRARSSSREDQSNGRKRKREPSATNHRNARSVDMSNCTKVPAVDKVNEDKPMAALEPEATGRSTSSSGRSQQVVKPIRAAQHGGKPLPKSHKSGGLVTNHSEPSRLQATVSIVDDEWDVPAVEAKSTLEKNRALSREQSLDLALPPSTPPRDRSGSAPSVHSKAVTTPKQAQIWGDLFDKAKSGQPRKLPSLSARHSGDHGTTTHGKSQHTRPKLIDSLQASLSSDPVELSPRMSAEHESNSFLGPGAHTQDASQETSTQSFTQLESSQPPSIITAAPRFTYAQQRSYLQDTSQGLDSLLAQPLDVGMPPLLQSSLFANGANAKSHGVDDSDDDDDDDDDVGGGPMKTIHELRAAGDTRRFDDAMNTMLDDLASSTKGALSGKRSALMDLFQRLRDTKFKGQFVEKSLEHAFVLRCKDESDAVCCSALALAVVMILKEPYDAKSGFHLWDGGVHGPLVEILDNVADLRKIAKERKTNMSRAAQSAVVEMVEAAYDTNIWELARPKVVSPQLASLTALETLIRRLREFRMSENIFDGPASLTLINIASSSIQDLVKGSPSKHNDAPTTAQLVLSILESMTVAPTCASDRNVWTRSTMTKLVQSLEDILDPELGLRVTTPLALRLCVNLANNNQENSEAFARTTFIGSLMARINLGFQALSDMMTNDTRQGDFDELLLALGALFNLAEMSEEVRRIISGDHKKHLIQMLETFSKSRQNIQDADSIAATRANVAFGYLAVLLGNVCLDEGGANYIREHLAGRKLAPLVDAVEEFIKHHKAVDQEGTNEVWAGFTDRLQNVAETLKAKDAG